MSTESAAWIAHFALMQLTIFAAATGGLLSYRRFGYAAVVGLALLLLIASGAYTCAPSDHHHGFWFVVGMAFGWMLAVPILAACAIFDAASSFVRSLARTKPAGSQSPC